MTPPDPIASAMARAVASEPFRPARGLAGAHVQTCWSALTRRVDAPAWQRRRLTMGDGGEVSVYLYAAGADRDHDDDAPLATGRPTLLLAHGLEGGPGSLYLRGLAHRFHAIGWNVAAMVFRTCDGDAPTTQRIYHSGETTDLDAVVRWLRSEGQADRVYLAGFSLGGNVSTKWLGEQGAAAPVEAAVIVSAPFDLGRCAETMDDVLRGFYSNRFLKTLRKKVALFNDRFPGLVDAERVAVCRSIVEYDDLVTAPIHGFDSAWDYYEKSSSAPLIPDIRRPTVLISSKDDPLIPGETLPYEAAAANPLVAPHWIDRGGHLGFVGGSIARGLRWWMEEAIERAFVAAEAAVQ